METGTYERQTIREGPVRAGAQSVSEKDIDKVVARSEEIKKKFRPGGPLQRFIVDGQLLIAMVKDYWARRYRKVPVGRDRCGGLHAAVRLQPSGSDAGCDSARGPDR